ncbi:GNVR domain-containing protein [Larkinella soli]|uniref:GNVR domain-containing protein n=1 Tax=Larkinella soli TaxID=1770527 RepID=UPI000FFC70BC|nr:GNVR domain-containing protein [Larkinella soli]
MTVSAHQSPVPSDVDDEFVQIRPADLRKFLQRSRTAVLGFALLGAVAGIYYAFSKPDEYTSEVIVMPEASSGGGGGMGNLGSIAGLAGISLDNPAGEAVRPDLYPNVLESIPFALDLLKQPVYAKQYRTTMPLQTYLKRQGRETFLDRLTGSTGDAADAAVRPPAPASLPDPKNYSRALQITPEQEGLANALISRITPTIDRRTGMVTIEAKMPDPVVSATVARLSLDYLTNYITSYRTQKIRNQAAFLTQQVEQSKRRYQSAEYALESYRDRNRSLYGGLARLEEQRLQADYLLAQTVYNDLSRQLEQAKIRVQEETPVFKMLEPPRIPLRKSGPRRTMIIVVAIVAGMFVGFGWTLMRMLFSGQLFGKRTSST